jgi:hypothetical protein
MFPQKSKSAKKRVQGEEDIEEREGGKAEGWKR